MLKITGDTYSYRRHLAKYGCKFSYEDKCWLSNHNEEIIDFCIKNDLKFENYEKDVKLDENFEVEQMNIRAKQKAEKYSERAGALEQKAEQTTISQQERDFLSLGEPIKIGHHSEGRHRRLLERTRKTYDKQHELYKKSEEYSNKAKYRENKVYRTEEDKKMKKELAKNHFQRAIDLRLTKHKVGDMYIGRHCSGEILKINKKSVIIKGNNSGQELKLDISYAKDFDLFLKESR